MQVNTWVDSPLLVQVRQLANKDPPDLHHHLKRQAMSAGKYTEWVSPADGITLDPYTLGPHHHLKMRSQFGIRKTLWPRS